MEPDQATEIRNFPLPLNVCILIDSSYSMSGDPLEKAKIGAKELIDRLAPSDYVTVVEFSGSAEIVVPGGKASNKEMIKSQIDKIKEKGSTHLHEGLERAYKELQKSTDLNSVKRIILLTDGCPTDVEGDSPLYPQIAKEMRVNGISITSLGIGEYYNEQLLIVLSENSGGSWYHINTPDTIPDIFSNELVNMSTVLLTRPELSIKAVDGVELFDLMKAEPNVHELNIEPSNREYIVPLNDVAIGVSQRIVGKLKAPIKPEGQLRVLKVDLLGLDVPISSNIILTYTNDENLYLQENDAFPRDLLNLTETTILLQKGTTTNNDKLIEEGKTKLKSIIGRTAIRDIWETGTRVYETTLKPGSSKEKLERFTQIRK